MVIWQERLGPAALRRCRLGLVPISPASSPGAFAYRIGPWNVGAFYRKINYRSKYQLTDLSFSGPMIGGIYRWLARSSRGEPAGVAKRRPAVRFPKAAGRDPPGGQTRAYRESDSPFRLQRSEYPKRIAWDMKAKVCATRL